MFALSSSLAGLCMTSRGPLDHVTEVPGEAVVLSL